MIITVIMPCTNSYLSQPHMSPIFLMCSSIYAALEASFVAYNYSNGYHGYIFLVSLFTCKLKILYDALILKLFFNHSMVSVKSVLLTLSKISFLEYL